MALIIIIVASFAFNLIYQLPGPWHLIIMIIYSLEAVFCFVGLIVSAVAAGAHASATACAIFSTLAFLTFLCHVLLFAMQYRSVQTFGLLPVIITSTVLCCRGNAQESNINDSSYEGKSYVERSSVHGITMTGGEAYGSIGRKGGAQIDTPNNLAVPGPNYGYNNQGYNNNERAITGKDEVIISPAEFGVTNNMGTRIGQGIGKIDRDSDVESLHFNVPEPPQYGGGGGGNFESQSYANVDF